MKNFLSKAAQISIFILVRITLFLCAYITASFLTGLVYFFLTSTPYYDRRGIFFLLLGYAAFLPGLFLFYLPLSMKLWKSAPSLLFFTGSAVLIAAMNALFLVLLFDLLLIPVMINFISTGFFTGLFHYFILCGAEELKIIKPRMRQEGIHESA